MNSLLFRAVKERASDIHIEPEEKDISVRYRIDGVLREVIRPPKRFQASIVEPHQDHGRPQHRREAPAAGRPHPHQDRRQGRRHPPLDRADRARRAHRHAPPRQVERDARPRPSSASRTGSSRSWTGSSPARTASCSSPARPAPARRRRSTARSPRSTRPTSTSSPSRTRSRSSCSGIGQVQVNPKIELTFANGLRSFLRQDPDVIMVGEIRDLETAEIAIQASLTGHLVLSTVHTNDAAGAITRLVDMGVQPFLVASSLVGRARAAPRARALPGAASRPYVPDARRSASRSGLTDEILAAGREPDAPSTGPQGCPACQSTGYQGRTGIYELMLVDDDIRQLILKNVDSGTIKRAAVAHGMLTLLRARRVQGRARDHHRGRGAVASPRRTSTRPCRSSSTRRSPPAGKAVQGLREADSPKTLRATLRREGVFLTEVRRPRSRRRRRPAREVNVRRWVLGRDRAPRTSRSPPGSSRCSSHAGIPLVEALTALVEQVDKEKLKRVLGDVKQRVNEGASLGRRARRAPEGLRRPLRQHDPRRRAVRRARDRARPARRLHREPGAAPLEDRRHDGLPGRDDGHRRGRPRASSSRSSSREITKIFEDTKATLPWTTRVAHRRSPSFVTQWWWALLPSLAARRSGASCAGRRTPAGRGALGPLRPDASRSSGGSCGSIAIGRFARTLSTLLKSGVPLLTAMDIVKNVVGNVRLAEVIEQARDAIREGESHRRAAQALGRVPAARLPHGRDRRALRRARGDARERRRRLRGPGRDHRRRPHLAARAHHDRRRWAASSPSSSSPSSCRFSRSTPSQEASREADAARPPAPPRAA